MRYFLAALAIAGAIALGATPASARGYHRHHLTHKYAQYLSARHFHRFHRHWRHYARRHYRGASHSALPDPCRVAASMGGPCGCWAAYVLLDRLDHVWHGINLWLANDWLRFPHVAPEVATAFVWPNRHVAPAVPGTYHNGTVVVRDSWRVHRIRVAGLVPVDPLRVFAPRSPRRLIAWPSSVPL